MGSDGQVTAAEKTFEFFTSIVSIVLQIASYSLTVSFFPETSTHDVLENGLREDLFAKKTSN